MTWWKEKAASQNPPTRDRQQAERPGDLGAAAATGLHVLKKLSGDKEEIKRTQTDLEMKITVSKMKKTK